MEKTREITVRGIILGAIITFILTGSNVFLGLKVGLTMATSIPAVVISMLILKSTTSGNNILENNIVQTQASAAGTISSIIFVLPGILMVGHWTGFHFWQTTLICISGGALGVIFTIPLRKNMVVKSENSLPYPEGIAAAEVLKVGGDKENIEGAKNLIFGSLFAGLVSLFTGGFRLLLESYDFWFRVKNYIFRVPFGFSLAMLGAGYLMGVAAAIAIFFGIFLTWFILVPIYSSSMSFDNASIVEIGLSIWNAKVKLIGIGVICIASLTIIFSYLGPMYNGIKEAITSYFSFKNNPNQKVEEVDRNLSFLSIFLISIISFITIFIISLYFVHDNGLSLPLNLLLVSICTIFIVLIGFFVSTASGYMAGLIGSSSSPISGIGLIAIIILSFILLLFIKAFNLGQLRDFFIALALFSTSIILSIACIANDNLQDLKTGYLVGATPARQQIALIIGVFCGAIVIAPILNILYIAYGFPGALPRIGMDPNYALSVPQASLMLSISSKIFSNSLDFIYIIIGIIIGLVAIFINKILSIKSNNKLHFPVIALGFGIYLPPSVNIVLMIGGFISYFIKKMVDKHENKKQLKNRGNLLASGFIVGESIIGIILAMITVISIQMGKGDSPLALGPYKYSVLVTTIIFILAIIFFYRKSTR